MSISSLKLKNFIEQLEALEDQKTDLTESIRDCFAEAKSSGFDTKILRQVLKVRRMKPEEISEQEELLQLYLDALRQ